MCALFVDQNVDQPAERIADVKPAHVPRFAVGPYSTTSPNVTRLCVDHFAPFFARRANRIRLIRNVSRPFRRNILLPFSRNIWFSPRCPVPDKRGASRSSRTLEAGCDGRFGARDERADAVGQAVWSWRPDAGVNLRVKSPGRRGLSSPAPRGERGAAVNTIAQGRPDCFGVPVVTCLRAFFTCTQGCGCDEHPVLPAPSLPRGPHVDASLGHSCRENANACPPLSDRLNRIDGGA